MRVRQIASIVVVVAGLGVAASGRTAASTEMPTSTPCYPGAIAGAFSGALPLDSINRFGCAGEWAFVWATVGSGKQEVSVTEVLRFDSVLGQWRFVSRESVCASSTLPTFVNSGGCHSN